MAVMSTEQQETAKRHLLTIALEDYYQVGAFNHLIQQGQWYRFETRVERNTTRALDLLDEFGVQATFFVLGWIADTMPELVRQLAERGHEVASKGYYHRSILQMSPAEFRDDLARAREALGRASGQRILGYRVADQWFTPADLWALDVLAREGYEYDSSIAPRLRQFAREPWRRFPHTHQFAERTLWEFPISSADVLGWLIPVAGGNYMRQFPVPMVRRALARWDQTYSVPFTMYFHVWELDPDQPKISAAPFHQRVRQYRHLDRVPAQLRYYFERYRFTGIAAHLGLSTVPATAAATAAASTHPASFADRAPSGWSSAPVILRALTAPTTPRQPVTIIVPCYNEELVLPYLGNTLRSVQTELSDRYELHFIFVDDRSTDDTRVVLERVFGDWNECRILRHERNQGVAAAIRTGLRHAETEVVCSIDCDCTYDPHELGRMIPLLTEEMDLVTASPYHRDGTVRNVPEWRLALSKTLSRLYRVVLHQKLDTYTSCFRVYRRSTTAGVPLSETGFLGVAELLGRLDLAGARVVEFPTTLEVRVLGRSKMKILRTILGHLRLLARLSAIRVFGPAIKRRTTPKSLGEPSVLPRTDVARPRV
jgi:polysaccharide deacetylase family protein (PEP-CTERM system associated)